MNQDRVRQQQRDAAASARNAKQVVERDEQRLSPSDRHWQRIARTMFEQGCEEPAVMEALRRQGAKAYIAADACAATRRHFRNVHHMTYRKDGLRGLVGGVALCVGGVAVVWLGHLLFVGGGMFLSGLPLVLVGCYKVLTGSSTPLVLPEDLV